jgi:histidinol-phosphate/aromatic aminotransferase/cobyric acid decarboxylase-like protein
LRGHYANMMLVEMQRRKPGDAVKTLAARSLLVADATSFRGLEDYNLLHISLRDRESNKRLVAALGDIA